MKKEIAVVVRVEAKKDRIELVKAELLKLVELTRKKEEGCLQYDLHQHNDTPEVFFLFERWESHEHYHQSHLKGKNFAEYNVATEGAVEDVIINELTKIA